MSQESQLLLLDSLNTIKIYMNSLNAIKILCFPGLPNLCFLPSYCRYLTVWSGLSGEKMTILLYLRSSCIPHAFKRLSKWPYCYAYGVTFSTDQYFDPILINGSGGVQIWTRYKYGSRPYLVPVLNVTGINVYLPMPNVLVVYNFRWHWENLLLDHLHPYMFIAWTWLHAAYIGSSKPMTTK